MIVYQNPSRIVVALCIDVELECVAISSLLVISRVINRLMYLKLSTECFVWLQPFRRTSIADFWEILEVSLRVYLVF